MKNINVVLVVGRNVEKSRPLMDLVKSVFPDVKMVFVNEREAIIQYMYKCLTGEKPMPELVITNNRCYECVEDLTEPDRLVWSPTRSKLPKYWAKEFKIRTISQTICWFYWPWLVKAKIALLR